MGVGRLSGLEVRHLLALQAIVEEGSFRAAADRLGYAQPSVSAQIAALEQIIGMPLLERQGGRPVRLTDSGEAFYGHAIPALTRLGAGGLAASRTAESGDDRPLRLGTFPSAADRYVSPLLASLERQPPAVEVNLRESTAVEELEALVMRGELDLTFSIQPFAERDIVGVALNEDPFVLLAPTASGLAQRSSPLTVKELARLPLIASSGCAHISHLENWMRLRGLDPTFIVRTGDDRLTHSLVAEGAGFAILGQMQVDPHRTDTITVGLGDLLPPRVISLAWHPDRPLRRRAEDVVERVMRVADLLRKPRAGVEETLLDGPGSSDQRTSRCGPDRR